VTRGARLVRRGRGDHGVALVEAAFALPVFLLLVFGVIEWGLFFSGSATSTSAARNGSRFASANFAVSANKQVAADSIKDVVQGNLVALTGQDEPIALWIYEADANGNPSTGNFTSCTVGCYRYTWNTATSSFDFDLGSPGWTNPKACLKNPPVDYIGVYVQVRHTYVTGFLNRIVGATSTINEHATARLEPLPSTQC
jgi:Flp pilus assembly protein TadG